VAASRIALAACVRSSGFNSQRSVKAAQIKYPLVTSADATIASLEPTQSLLVTSMASQ
jgi:hypothetical protein